MIKLQTGMYINGFHLCNGSLAYTALGQHRDAKDCYQRALTLDPNNESYRDNLRQCEQMIREETVNIETFCDSVYLTRFL
jgi:tetratricopeptide (TPR) repeat protein